MATYTEFHIGVNDSEKRLDRVVRVFLGETPLSTIYKSIRTGNILINGKKKKPGYRVSEGDRIDIRDNLLPSNTGVYPEENKTNEHFTFTNNILYENDDILAINKPSGIKVHDGNNSLEAAVRNYLRAKLPESLSFQPGPIHRLDRNVSGLILFSKSIKGAREGAELFKNKAIEKYYIALCENTVKKGGSINSPLSRDKIRGMTEQKDSGVPAKTDYTPIVWSEGYTLLLIRIHTGRTHQIRAHMAHSGYPIVGDTKYGAKNDKNEILLHSWVIKFPDNCNICDKNILYAPIYEKKAKRIAHILGFDSLGPLIDRMKNRI